jgi:osmotically-inducible protein OsmY
MATKDRREGKEAERLRKLGFEFESPVDDYSYQPDSGSRIGGLRGRQEYGIRGGVSSESDTTPQAPSLQDNRLLDQGNVESSGVSEFSEEATHGAQALEREAHQGQTQRHHQLSTDDLGELIQERLEHHAKIDVSSIHISLTSSGVVTLEGEAHSVAERLRVEEVVSAIPGVREIANHLRIRLTSEKRVT